MPAVADLRRRIANIRNVRQLARAMKAVAAARLARARAAAAAARPYAGEIGGLLARLAAAPGIEHPLLLPPGAPAPAGRRCLLVIAGDRGLAGGFNAAVVRAALDMQKAREGGGPAPAFIAVGRRAVTALRFRGADLRETFTGLDDPVPPELSRAVAARLLDGLAAGEFAAVDLVYNRFVSVLVQRPAVEPLLPVVPPAPEDVERRKGPQPLYIVEPSPQEVLGELVPAYVTARVHRALAESRAGEHAARMAAMDAAVRNAGEAVDRLTRELSRRRQQAITMEILDIVGGAAAIDNR
ncbi:MAG: ATP synthase F1 subunit gamma [Thermoanaerobacterales bacterium]|nr:ATP synthase F1 subunit gamma [Bacillota bacterium]MDI6907485.1 ATP synthase F1 subunit gamma [Thermoanaerobacterales bacterium]